MKRKLIGLIENAIILVLALAIMYGLYSLFRNELFAGFEAIRGAFM